MKVKSYKNIKMVLFGLTLMGVVLSYIYETGIIAFLGVGIYMVLVSLLKTRVDGVVEDERIKQVSSKSAQVSFQILVPILGLSSLAMIMAGGKEDFYYVEGLGIVTSYIACLALIIYVLAYRYFDRQSGGK